MAEQQVVVRVYTKPNCGPCFATKRALKKEGIEFIEEDATGGGNLEALKYLGHLSAPIVVAGESGEDMWSGFKLDRIKELANRINMEGK